MKPVFIVLTAACLAVSAPALRAQAPATDPAAATPATPAAPAAAGKHAKREARMQNLTPEEQQTLRAARKTAMQDPAVQSTKGDRRAHRKALREAMLKSDPSVAAILEKMKTGRRESRIF